MLNQIISIIQIILGAVLITLVLLQAKGTGLGSTFGGETGFYRTKRGFEKLLFYLTIAVVAFFVIFTILGLVL